PPALAGRVVLAALAGLALFGLLNGCKPTTPADVPGEFTFHGVAVHPAAVSALYNSATGQIDLASFKTNFEARQWEDQPGWWTTDFEQDPASGRSPFFAYVAFAGPNTGGAELYILSVIFNQGETADIDNIVLLQKSGSWLSLVRMWNEGSACNGGISNQRVDKDNFLYSRELTPTDLLGLSVGAGLTLTANEDLESTSESCFASANYVYNLTLDREDLVSVRLYDEPVKDEKGRTERYRYQSCFNRIFNDTIARGKTALTPKEVDELAIRFRDECVKPAGRVPAPIDK
ncbi:MAG TPA: hypothetical protein VKT17_09340, partial [Acidobacteriota bacterium]|nr:hypothetical protein [Acidobacteriota bacterium]